jgi:hypothetical protein
MDARGHRIGCHRRYRLRAENARSIKFPAIQQHLAEAQIVQRGRGETPAGGKQLSSLEISNRGFRCSGESTSRSSLSVGAKNSVSTIFRGPKIRVCKKSSKC